MKQGEKLAGARTGNGEATTAASRKARWALGMLLCGVLAACGGGTTDSATSSTTSDALASSVLTSGDATTWSVHSVDDSGSVIDQKYTDTVTTVNSDQSYVRTLATVGGPIALVHGTDYTINEVENYAAGGLLTDVTKPDLGRTCTFSNSPQAVPHPIAAGMTWSKQWTKTCTDGYSANITLTNGHWVALEPLQIALGTFTANKVNYTVTETPTAGGSTVITSTYDCWFDTIHGRNLKCQRSVSHSGTPSTTGYAVTTTEELQSITRAGATASSLPSVGASNTVSRHVVDNTSSAVDLTFTSAVTSVDNSAHTYVSTGTTQGGSTITLNDNDYTVNGENIYSSTGLQLSSTNKQPTPNVTCTYSQAPQTVFFPLTPGQSWTNQWVESCTNGFSANVALTGEFIDSESVTVTAGTFTANKVSFVITSTPTTINPIVTTETHTCWYEALSRRTLKCHVDRTHTGTVTSAFAVSIDDQLQSFH